MASHLFRLIIVSMSKGFLIKMISYGSLLYHESALRKQKFTKLWISMVTIDYVYIWIVLILFIYENHFMWCQWPCYVPLYAIIYRVCREQWIRAKYERKEFVHATNGTVEKSYVSGKPFNFTCWLADRCYSQVNGKVFYISVKRTVIAGTAGISYWMGKHYDTTEN